MTRVFIALVGLLPAVVAFVVTWYLCRIPQKGAVCYKDLEYYANENCRIACQHGYFSVPGMRNCRPWLACEDFADITVLQKIGGGAVKTVYLAKWHEYEVVLNRLAEPLYTKDFQHGLQMLSEFHPSPFVTQLIGLCDDAYITEYHRHRSADYLVELLESEKFRKYNTLAVRFGLCLDYAELLAFLHNSSLGVRVMCDSNDLAKTLNQFLVTADLRLIMNDLDALPQVTLDKKITCGHRELRGDFVAPEQRWPFANQPFVDEQMPPYDEKSDVWKIPEICLHFLSDLPDARALIFHLFKIHQKCKAENPRQRAAATEVYSEYKHIYKKFELERLYLT